MTALPVASEARFETLRLQVEDLLSTTPGRYVVMSESSIMTWAPAYVIGYAKTPVDACDAIERLQALGLAVPCERFAARVDESFAR